MYYVVKKVNNSESAKRLNNERHNFKTNEWLLVTLVLLSYYFIVENAEKILIVSKLLTRDEIFDKIS